MGDAGKEAKGKEVKFYSKKELKNSNYTIFDILKEYSYEDYRFIEVPNPLKKIKNRENGIYVLHKYDDMDENGNIYTLENKTTLEQKELEAKKKMLLQDAKEEICSQISKNVSEHQQLNMIIDLIADCYNDIKQAFNSKEIQKLLKENADINTLITSLIDVLKNNAPQHIENIKKFIKMRDNILNEYNKKKSEIAEVKTIEELKRKNSKE